MEITNTAMRLEMVFKQRRKESSKTEAQKMKPE